MFVGAWHRRTPDLVVRPRPPYARRHGLQHCRHGCCTADDRLGHPDREDLHRRSPRRLERGAAARPSRSGAVHAWCVPVDVHHATLDDAAVLGLRFGRADQPTFQVPARCGPDRVELCVRPADADGLRLRRRSGRGRSRQGRCRHRHHGRHAAVARRPSARQGLDVDDDQLDRRDPAADVRTGRRGAGRFG